MKTKPEPTMITLADWLRAKQLRKDAPPSDRASGLINRKPWLVRWWRRLFNSSRP